MAPERGIFALILLLALALFARGAFRRFSLLALGRPEERFDRPLRRLGQMALYAFAQARVVRGPFGPNHLVLFWAFLLLLLANGEFVVNGLFPSTGFFLLPAPAHEALLFAFDLVSLLALACVALAAGRRLFFAPPWMSTPWVRARGWEGFLILSLVGLLMVAFFGMNGARIAAGDALRGAAMPVSSLAGSLLAGASPAGLAALQGSFWWLHAVVLLAFLAFLPHSKHLHILTAIPNCFMKSLPRPNTQPREQFVKGAELGAARVDQLTWKDLFDGFSCTECGRCQRACPAQAVGKPLNPRQVVHAVKSNLLANARALRAGLPPSVPLVARPGEAEAEGTLTEEALWACTTCGACLAECPVFIEQMPKIVKMRRALVEMEARFPPELLNLFENMEQRGNPWGIAPGERLKWCAGLDIPAFETGKTEYLLFVGCAGALDARSKAVTLALAEALRRGGVSFGILGRDEPCCGDSPRRLGNEYVFDRMARANAALFRARGVGKVIVQCPHCLSTLRNDYRQYGVEMEVLHHTEVLARLLRDGRLTPQARGPGSVGGVVFHDPCYLGRHNGVYQAPRQALRAATGAPPLEMDQHGARAFCCGAGGGRMWMEEPPDQRVNLARIDQALATGARTLAVGCPYCLTMFEDALKDREVAGVRVRDVAELVAEGIKDS